MKKILCILLLATCLLSACANPLIEEVAVQIEDSKSVIATIEQTEKPNVTSPVESEDPQATQTPNPTVIPTVMPSVKPEEKVTEESTPTPTVKPTAEPTKAPTSTITPPPTAEPTKTPIPIITQTPKPTVEPTPEPIQDNKGETDSVSSAFINAAMAEINRQRVADGVSPATFSSSISSSCKSHAIAMAESGSVFHASGIYMYEAVGRASNHMPGATMGSSAVAHVVQMKSEEVTQIGIGAVYCGSYLYYVVRGN